MRLTFVADDGGRAAAGFKGTAGDCVARSITIASGRPYAEIYAALSEGSGTERAPKRGRAKGRSARNGIHTTRKWFKDLMRSLGFEWTPTMGIGTGCKVHLHDDELPAGRLVVAVSRHYTAVIDGVIHDTYDPRRDEQWIEYIRTPRPLKPGETLIPHALVENGVEVAGVATVRRRCVYGYWKVAPP